MTQLTNTYPNAAARCLVDMLNEPDAFKLQWQAQNGLPGAHSADSYTQEQNSRARHSPHSVQAGSSIIPGAL